MVDGVALRRRSPLAPIVLLSLGVAALLVPACRLGYEELDVTDGMLSGGDGNTDAGTSSGNASNMGGVPGDGGVGTGGSSVTGGSSTNGGSSVNGGTTTGGASGGTTGGGTTSGGTTLGAGGEAGVTGMPAGGEGGSGTACTGTVDCTCDTFNNHEYLFCRQSLTRDDANTYCQTNGMTLVRIDNATENDFVLTKATAYSVFVTPLFFGYIGANDQAVLGEWRWVDGALFWQGGTSGTLVQGMYASWDNKSPGTMSVQRCAGMLATGLWQDRSCTALNTFICESP
jgi:hypothetical protein